MTGLFRQPASRAVPGYLAVLDSAHSEATVRVWTGPAVAVPVLPGDPLGYFRTGRQGEYFRAEPGRANVSELMWAAVTNLAVLRSGSQRPGHQPGRPRVGAPDTGGAQV